MGNGAKFRIKKKKKVESIVHEKNDDIEVKEEMIFKSILCSNLNKKKNYNQNFNKSNDEHAVIEKGNKSSNKIGENIKDINSNYHKESQNEDDQEVLSMKKKKNL